MQTNQSHQIDKEEGCHCGGTVHSGCKKKETYDPRSDQAKKTSNGMQDHFRDKPWKS